MYFTNKSGATESLFELERDAAHAGVDPLDNEKVGEWLESNGWHEFDDVELLAAF